LLSETTVDHRRLQYVAATYPYMRGLLTVTAGLLCIVLSLGNWEWGPFGDPTVVLVVGLALVVLMLVINRAYDATYGRVTPSASQRWRTSAVQAIGFVVLVAGGIGISGTSSWSLHVPVNGVMVGFGAIMLAQLRLVGALAVHHLVIWGALIVVGLVPVWHGGDAPNVGLFVAGIAAVLSGAIDHLRLVRTFAGAAAGPEGARG
jgi:hypothetical protein